MKRIISYKETQCLYNAVSKKLARSMVARSVGELLVSEEQILATELNYACIVLDVLSLFDESPRERAEILHQRHLDYKTDIIIYTNFISQEEYKDCHRVRGRLEAIQWFYGEIVNLLDIEDNNETTQTAS